MHIAFVSHTLLNSHSRTPASPTQTHHLLYADVSTAVHEWVLEMRWRCSLRTRVCLSAWEFVLVALNLFNTPEGGMKLGEIRGNKASRMVWWWTWITSICIMHWALSHLCVLALRSDGCLRCWPLHALGF